MAYSLSNKCTKKFYKWTVVIQRVTEDVVTCFLKHGVVFQVLNTFAKFRRGQPLI